MTKANMWHAADWGSHFPAAGNVFCTAVIHIIKWLLLLKRWKSLLHNRLIRNVLNELIAQHTLKVQNCGTDRPNMNSITDIILSVPWKASGAPSSNKTSNWISCRSFAGLCGITFWRPSVLFGYSRSTLRFSTEGCADINCITNVLVGYVSRLSIKKKKKWKKKILFCVPQIFCC